MAGNDLINDRGYEGWYERMRQSDDVTTKTLRTQSSNRTLSQFMDTRPSRGQKNALNNKLAEDDREEFNRRNSTDSDNKANIPEENVYRPSGMSESVVETKQGRVSIEKIDSAWKHQGHIYLHSSDGKRYTLRE